MTSRALPRTSTLSEVPTAATPGSTKAIAIGWPRATDEVTLLLKVDDSPKAGLGGMDVGSQLMPVEGHAGFQTQGVATGEPTRGEVIAAGLHEKIPEVFGGLGRYIELVTVLTGVSSTGDERGGAVELSGQAAVVLDVADLVGIEGGVGLRQGRQHDLDGLGSLHCDEGRLS